MGQQPHFSEAKAAKEHESHILDNEEEGCYYSTTKAYDEWKEQEKEEK